MSRVDEQGRPEPPVAGDEVSTLLGFLDFHRATLEWKCDGLGADDLAITIGPSTMTLGGLLTHLAFVEDHWFSFHLLGQPRCAPWDAVDWRSNRDGDWTRAAEHDPDEVRAMWRDAVARSRRIVDQALAAGGLDTPCARPWSDGTTPTLRWVLVHMVEEYSRHNGHADLLREAIDGSVGE
ncbi:DinB family protein [Actinomarinicola tropica]|uniref:DUF664 domain-containing protein n=1 Tax=Actinomarinicola tropica TaxID=2789776 RepID=A0A5Q2RKN3_9ACTN|nr:DinB family protein [Actinomarinicola tropica]QGG96044.1 DUF664 domain-containing protein [Actinomarinicola tropica]